MNEQALNDAYNLFVSNGYKKSIDDFKILINTNENALKDSYNLFSSNGYKKSIDDFSTLLGVKKKDGASVVQKQQMEKPTASALEGGLLASQQIEDISKLGLTKPQVAPTRPTPIPTQQQKQTLAKERAIAKATPEEPIVEEKDYFEGGFGDFLRGVDSISPIGIGDFIDDMSRSVAAGYRQGTAAQEADNLLLKGTKATPEQIQKFIDANKNAQQVGQSVEMQEYQKTYEKEGKGFWGVVKGLASNPSIVPEVLTSSLISMATNTDALTAGAAAIGTGATYGAGAGAVAGGVGAAPGAVAGAIAAVPYAFGLASSVVEAGSTFGELLTDELKGKELTKENVKSILENPEKLQTMRNKAIARGLIIGTVDALTGKLASGVGAKIIGKSAAKSATGAVTKTAATGATAAGSLIESIGGSAGEAAARAAIGQKMDVSEIALEGIGELPGGIRSTIQARLSKPSYKVNGENVSADEVDNLIETMTPSELLKTNIEIKNDYSGKKVKLEDKIITNNIKEQVRQASPELSEQSLDAITELEKNLKGLEGNTTQAGKDRVSAIKSQIKDIQENQKNGTEESKINSFTRILGNDIAVLEEAYNPNLNIDDSIEELNSIKSSISKETDVDKKQQLIDNAKNLQNQIDAKITVDELAKDKYAVVSSLEKQGNVSKEDIYSLLKKSKSIIEKYKGAEVIKQTEATKVAETVTEAPVVETPKVEAAKVEAPKVKDAQQKLIDLDNDFEESTLKDDYLFDAKKQLESKAKKPMFGKAKEPTKEEVKAKALEMYKNKIESIPSVGDNNIGVVVHGTLDGSRKILSEGVLDENIITPLDARKGIREGKEKANEKVLPNSDRVITVTGSMTDNFGRAGGITYEFIIPNNSNAKSSDIIKIIDEGQKNSAFLEADPDVKRRAIKDLVSKVKDYISTAPKAEAPVAETPKVETPKKPKPPVAKAPKAEEAPAVVETPKVEEAPVVETPVAEELSDEAKKLNELLGISTPKAAPRKRTPKAEAPKAPVVEAPKAKTPVVKTDQQLSEEYYDKFDELQAKGLKGRELNNHPELLAIEKQREAIKTKVEEAPKVEEAKVEEAPVVDEVEVEYKKEFDRIATEKKTIRESKLKPDEKDVKLKALDTELTIANNKRKGIVEEKIAPKKQSDVDTLQGDIEYYQGKIEDAQEEIKSNVPYNYNEQVSEIKAKIENVKKSKLSKQEKIDAIDDLKSELEDAKDERDNLLEAYNDDIKELKSEIKKAQKQLDKLSGNGVSLTNKSSIDNLKTSINDSAKIKIIEAAQKAITTLKSVLPNFDIVVHDGEDSYNVAMDERDGVEDSAGNFSYGIDENGKFVGRIDINLSKANSRTVAHEVAHGIMLKTFGDNPKLFKTFRDKIATVLKGSSNKALMDFANQYVDSEGNLSDVTYEEYLAELTGALVTQEEKLSATTLQKIAEVINQFVSRLTNGKLKPFDNIKDTKQVIDFFNNISESIRKGEEIKMDGDDTLNGSGEVGTFNIPSKSQIVAPKASEDSRDFIKNLVEDIDIREFNGKKFVTNMYDYTTAGVADLGNGFEINMLGGKNYVPYMMSLQNKKIGDVSNLAAFNTKAQAEGFIRNAKQGNADLFAPHSGTLSASWQFQQHTFAELVNLILDKGIMKNQELIKAFNKTIESGKANKKAFAAFEKKYKTKYQEDIQNFNSFESNPKKIVELLDIVNNYSPDLRKALNNAISSNKTFQKAIGVKNKLEFFNKIMDPLNKGVKGGELIGVVKFDPNTFEVVQTKPDAIDHHPSFGWTLLAKIDGIYQPTEFHKSSESTETYTKYNLKSANVSRKATEPKYESKNVSSSAGAIPKVAEFISKAQLQKTNNEISKIIKVAKDNNFSDSAIKEVLKSRGFTMEEINQAFPKEFTKPLDILSNAAKSDVETRKNKLSEGIDKIIEKGKITIKNAESLKSKLEKLNVSSDAQVKKFLDYAEKMFVKKPTIEYVRDAYKATVNDIKNRRVAISDAIKLLVKDGSITLAQSANLISKLEKLNVNSDLQVNKFLDYAKKVFDKANYVEKLSEANKTKKEISKLAKDKNKNVELTALAKKFNDIKPSMVNDIDEYNEIASTFKDALKGTKAVGEKVNLNKAVNIDDVSKYIEYSVNNQNKKLYEDRLAEIQEMMDIDASEFSYEDLKNFFEDKESKPDKYKETIIRDTAKKMFDTYSGIINEMFKTGYDAFFEGEKKTFTDKQKEIGNRFMDMDLSILTPKEALDVIDSIQNFLENQSTAKMEDTLQRYEGELSARKTAKLNTKARDLRLYASEIIGRFFADKFTSLPLIFEKMFGGFDAGRKVQDAIGITELTNKKSAANKKSEMIVDDYVASFKDSKPNGKDFNEASNIIERGMAANMIRTVIGTQKEMSAEFERRKKLIEESIDVLSRGNKKEKEKSKLYQDAYDKLLKDSNSADEVKSKTDKENLKAVDWWVNKWAENYEEMSDVSLNVYNKILDKDFNYTPDRIPKLQDKTDTKVDLSSNDSQFHQNNGTTYTKESGSLMKAEKPSELPKDRYIDLSFDTVNSNAMYDSLIDISTAGTIRRVESFLNSDSFEKIFPNASDAALLKKRVNLYVRNIRKKNIYKNDTFSDSMNKLNRLANIGIGQALGGVSQPFKQVIPVAWSTIINAGRLDLGVLFNEGQLGFIERSGMAISNRGQEAQTGIESVNKLLDEAAKSNLGKATKLIEKANSMYLKIFLKNPDVFIAKASWISYYEKSLKKQGVDIKNLNYETDKLNQEAANYAQGMVDKQQNISDQDLAGEIFSDKGGMAQYFKATVLPFASFRMNQSMRMMTDISNLQYWKTMSIEDRKTAVKSLSALAVEMAAFKAISVGFSLLWGSLANMFMKNNESEEEKKKRRALLIKGQATSLVTDLLSPLPITDKLVAGGTNLIIDKVQDALDVAEDDKWNIYGATPNDIAQSLGTLGIAGGKAYKLGEAVLLAKKGKFVDDYGNKKILTSKGKRAVKIASSLYFLGAIGVLPPAESANIANNLVRTAKKKVYKPIE